MSIQFSDKPHVTTVKLDGRVVGHIRQTLGGDWRYCPKDASSKFFGPVMPSLAAVKQSLIGESLPDLSRAIDQRTAQRGNT